MMHKEFEQIAGYEVSYEDYTNYIEPMYMALPGTISKQDFINMIDKKRFALKPIKNIVKDMKEIAAHIKDICTHYTDYEAKDKLESLITEYMNRKNYPDSFGYIISEQRLWTCYFPTTIKIYCRKTGCVVETIDL